MMPSALVVDENANVASLHEDLLRSSGFTTRVARNGQEAVNIVSLGNNFDAIFMNKKLPITDGPTATMMLRILEVKSLILGLTTADDPERQEFIEAGLDDCFDTPLNSDQISKVFQLLDNARFLTG